MLITVYHLIKHTYGIGEVIATYDSQDEAVKALNAQRDLNHDCNYMLAIDQQ